MDKIIEQKVKTKFVISGEQAWHKECELQICLL